MISCHDWKLGRPYVHNLRTCEQVHFRELGTEILAVESPSSEEKWLFLAGWRLPRKKFPRNSDKWACSCRLSLRGRRKKGREIGRGRKSPFFPSSQCSVILRRQQAQCLQDVEFFTDSAILRFDWVVASLKYSASSISTRRVLFLASFWKSEILKLGNDPYLYWFIFYICRSFIIGCPFMLH